jgi:DNA-directed RNA polymerase specialized sigma24 family protein
MPRSITEALAAWKAGEDQAQFDLVDRLRTHLLELVGLVRHRRNERLRPRINSEAVVWEALNSFLTGLRKNEFPNVNNREDVRKLLTTIVLRTLVGQVRWNMSKKRTAILEQPSNIGRPDHLLQPTETNAKATDRSSWLAEFEHALRSTHEKAMIILELTLKGFSNNDIAREVGLGARMVQLIKQRTSQLLREEFNWQEE